MSDLFKEKKEPVKKKTIIIKYPQLANPVKIGVAIVDKRNIPINRTAILNKLGIKEVKQLPQLDIQQPEPALEPAPEPTPELAPEPALEPAPELAQELAQEPAPEPAQELAQEPAPEVTTKKKTNRT